MLLSFLYVSVVFHFTFLYNCKSFPRCAIVLKQDLSLLSLLNQQMICSSVPRTTMRANEEEEEEQKRSGRGRGKCSEDDDDAGDD